MESFYHNLFKEWDNWLCKLIYLECIKFVLKEKFVQNIESLNVSIQQNFKKYA